MIARIWRTGIRPGRGEAYEDFAREVSLPMFREQQGYAGVIMGRNEDSAWVLTLWHNQAAVDALATSPTYQATVARIVAADLLDGEQTTEVAEMHLLDMPAAATE